MSVHADRLELLLPADAPEGPGRVRARVRDDVGNEAARELVVAIVGVPYVPPEPPPTLVRPGWPAPRRRRPRERVVRGRSRVRARSRVRVAPARRVRTRLMATSHARLVAGPPPNTAVVLLRSRDRLAIGRAAASGELRVRSRATVRRRDGGDDEALLLGLL
jgi:hypothetical protein